jgi:hypothetical protein
MYANGVHNARATLPPHHGNEPPPAAAAPALAVSLFDFDTLGGLFDEGRVQSMVENDTACKVPGALTTDLIRELWRDVVEEETIMVHKHGAVNDVAPGHFAPHSASEQNNGRRWTRPLPSAEGIEQGSLCDGCDGCDGSG